MRRASTVCAGGGGGGGGIVRSCEEVEAVESRGGYLEGREDDADEDG